MRWSALIFVVACGNSSPGPDPDAAVLQPTANAAREVIDTNLAVDYAGMTSVATVTLGPSDSPGASLEAAGLMIDSVTVDGAALLFTPPSATQTLDLALPASTANTAVAIAYHWMDHEGFQGISSKGFTLDWPYYCGNVFPCHSQPSDGTTFSLALTNTPTGKTAVFPTMIPSEAPAYQLAWSIDDYTQLDLGTTAAGTAISVWYRPNEMAAAMTGTQHLVAAFDWLEKTLGPYRFGNHYGSVSVKWGPGQFGGMEHHPFVHIGSSAIGDEDTNVHEASHGWFGDGIRIACWEDFVLSEGTVNYLAARSLDVVAPTVGASVWATYASELSALKGTDLVWPQSCGSIDVIKDKLFTEAPYVRGAYFYKGVADKVGAENLDHALSAFYMAHAGGAAKMSEMLATIQQVTGYDATACAATWLTSTTLPTPAPCP